MLFELRPIGLHITFTATTLRDSLKLHKRWREGKAIATQNHHANNLFCYYYDMLLLHKKEVLLALFRPSANFYCNLQDTKSDADHYFYVMFCKMEIRKGSILDIIQVCAIFLHGYSVRVVTQSKI